MIYDKFINLLPVLVASMRLFKKEKRGRIGKSKKNSEGVEDTL